MNEIFLWFWLADIMGGISVIGIACLIAVIVVAITGAVESELNGEEAGKRVFKLIYWLLIPIAVSVVVPDRNTVKMYAIAKAGNLAVSETAIGKKSMQALEAILDDIIEKKGKK